MVREQEENAHIGFDNLSVTTNCAACPNLSAAPANVSVTNSTCDATCTVSGGLISAPSGTPCPLGSTLQYSVNGGTWSTTLPVYAQTGPVQSIETRCLCDLDGTTASPVSTAVITAPGTCTLPTQPTITIVNNVCPSTIGTISATGCGSGTTLEWATNAAGSWSTVIPTYTTSPLTVYARCRDNITNCVSPSASSTTAPVSCGAFSFTISDPCSCNNDATLAGNDGTFNEVITVTGPTGFTLTATCVGCTPSTLSFTEGPAGTYVSNTFTHVDNVGYTAQIFANGSGVGSISNICAYPNVAVNPIGPFTDCDGQAAVPLTATIVGDNGSGTYAWSGTGIAGSTFNPSGLDPGIVVVSLNYTGVNLGNISPDGVTPAYPGCIQPDTIQVRITQAVAPPVISNITVCEGENTTLSVSSTSGPGPEETFTAGWIFDTEVTSGTVSGLGAGDISVVNASTGSGLGSLTFPGGNPPSALDSYSANNWTSNSFPDANDYFEFCLNATGGYQIDLSSFSFDGYRSNTGPANAQISISINGAPFANIGAPISIPTGFGSNPMFTIPLAVSNATSICIRISGYSASAASTAGTFRVDNVSFIGQGQLIIGPPTGTYNFYSHDPTINPTSVPVFVGNSYDPGTTAATSPDTIWVTCVDQLTGCESAPDTVIVIVNPNPVLAIIQPSPACNPSTVNVLNVALGESPAGGTISYHATMADAEGDVNPITSGLDAVSVTTTIFVRYELANGCFIVGQINVVINAMPPPPTVPSTISVCSGGSTLITVDTNPVTVTTTWDFESGIAGQGISSNMVVAGNGATQTAGSGLGSVGTQAAGSGCTAAITSTAYDITNASLADAVADNEYFEFCIGAPMAGFVFNGVTGINWNHRISGTGPISWALVAAGSPNTPLLSGSIAGTSCVGAGGTIALNPSTCYRVYYWGATNVSGTLRIDNFNILAQYQNLAIYNWFNVNPDTNPEAIPVATGNSYDPMTTAATSPQTVWVNCNNGCVSTASQVVINAGITPTVNAVPNQALCPGASTNAITFSGTPTGVSFSWTNNNTSIGLAASGSGNISSFVAVNATTINQVATITVTPSYTSGGVTCMGEHHLCLPLLFMQILWLP
ncbi:MAG: hypothetical protein IPO48_11650 [Saprospiraceae bacterium]|nr:hypothetical protein [Saprospiraceae bacterium]